ncbi:MAG: hypothetical protein ABIV43_00545 [Candidatus Saccharimonadales bacterium]
MLRPLNKARLNYQGKTSPTSLITLLMLIGAAAVLYLNQYRVIDWIKLRDYQPSTAIVQLADEISLNDYSRHMFYLNKPELPTDVTSFRKDCPENEDTIVLGCYRSVQLGIYVYNVQDPELAGVQQVTAAHETLHAIYDRLSKSDRQTIDAQLMDYYKNGLTDQRVKDEIKIYQKTEPTALLNEMHSIFGTEVKDLPAPLEQYYQRYFTDRSKILAFGEKYQAQFTQRQAALNDADQRLSNLKAEIDAQQADLDVRIKQISADRARLNGYAQANDTANYNAAVPGFNRSIEAYNAAINQLKAKIEQYNQLVVSRNQIASQLSALDKALDTRTVQPVKN